ncbi:MAG: hypothetical protein JRI44_12180 [Deltaproteobacteria bacterium]|nr:hypothetical protein [Deltaproteobacteria bacterium]
MREIANLADCSHTTVNRWVKKLEIKVNGRGREVELRNLLLSLDEKITGREIREQFKTAVTVEQKKRKMPIPKKGKAEAGLEKIDYTVDDEMDKIMLMFEGHY